MTTNEPRKIWHVHYSVQDGENSYGDYVVVEADDRDKALDEGHRELLEIFNCEEASWVGMFTDRWMITDDDGREVYVNTVIRATDERWVRNELDLLRDQLTELSKDDVVDDICMGWALDRLNGIIEEVTR